MSRIAKLPVAIPEGVVVNVANNLVKVTGKSGELVFAVAEQVKIEMEEGKVKVKVDNAENSYLAGMTRTMIANMVTGVSQGWNKTLELNGTGYRASVAGQTLNLALGLSHPVSVQAPDGIGFEVKENKITVKGSDKSLVGEVAAKIRALRPADPYKHKGFKYEGEVLIKKAGKAAKAGGAK